MGIRLKLQQRGAGILAALASAVCLGFTPVLGKLAINLGISPLGVVAWRTLLAAALILRIRAPVLSFTTCTSSRRPSTVARLPAASTAPAPCCTTWRSTT